jgi:23S rRNA (cytosine1962-C5)-methyltransferase
MSANTTLRLNHPNRPRATRGHPWVFRNELREPAAEALHGEVAELRDASGRPLGWGIVNKDSQIAWRRVGRDRPAMDADWFAERLAAAVARRAPDSARRLVWSESDGLPGVVLDQYGDCLSLQVMTLAIERRLPVLLEAIQRVLAPREIVLRHDAPVRRLEGLPLEVRTASGKFLDPFWLPVGGLEQWIDLQGGQKTGLYLDQRFEHARVAEFAKGRRVLDLCCNSGGFALHAARAGAASVLGIDSSADALELARRNAAHTGVAAVCEWREANVFDYLNTLEAGAEWDVIILDPPPFARSHKALEGAIRGYKELHLRCLRHLSKGGILATYACSHHVTHDLFLELIGSAAHDARVPVRVLEHRHQPPDHPVTPGMPESEYLRGFLLQVG